MANWGWMDPQVAKDPGKAQCPARPGTRPDHRRGPRRPGRDLLRARVGLGGGGGGVPEGHRTQARLRDRTPVVRGVPGGHAPDPGGGGGGPEGPGAGPSVPDRANGGRFLALRPRSPGRGRLPASRASWRPTPISCPPGSNLVSIHMYQGRTEGVAREWLHIFRMGGTPAPAMERLKAAAAGGGVEGVLRSRLDYMKGQAESTFVSPYIMANFYSYLGDTGRGLRLPGAILPFARTVLDLPEDATQAPPSLKADPRWHAVRGAGSTSPPPRRTPAPEPGQGVPLASQPGLLPRPAKLLPQFGATLFRMTGARRGYRMIGDAAARGRTAGKTGKERHEKGADRARGSRGGGRRLVPDREPEAEDTESYRFVAVERGNGASRPCPRPGPCAPPPPCRWAPRSRGGSRPSTSISTTT